MGRRPADLSGRKFGMLTAKYATEKRDKRGSVYWHCVCDCGNEVDVTAAGLVHGIIIAAVVYKRRTVRKLRRDDIS